VNDEMMWQAKVLAYLHDPAEKALILLRGRGHEAGTVADMRELLGVDLARLHEAAGTMRGVVKKADTWAAAADRPSLPKRLGGRVAFATDPQLIHPLTGSLFDIQELASDAHARAVEAVSFDHFKRLVVWQDAQETQPDWRRTFLKLWRFAPETPARDLGVLWNVLPADTRSPDHTIWDHLRLTSALSGPLASDPAGPALLLMSFGPVQSFIAQARSVSDLWAGSHLLSQIAWEGLKEICEKLGPDAVLFPDLHGVAVADLWLKERLGEWPGSEPGWMQAKDDTNPLFAAALPNRFVALVQAGQAECVAKKIEEEVRKVVKGWACDALDELMQAARRESKRPDVALEQIERQFKDFPEIHWAIVPWNLAGTATLDDGRLKELLTRIGASPAYLDRNLDGLLRGEITVAGYPFFTPNPGTGYPGLYEALERLHAAAKAARPFHGEAEKGYRCTLCGEREWLTDTQKPLNEPSGKRKARSLWDDVAQHKPALAKSGEHLCAICALKRARPRLFVKKMENAIPELGQIDRFVLSTRSLAMATSLWNWLDQERRGWPDESSGQRHRREEAEQALRALLDQDFDLKGATLPRRLYDRIMTERSGDKDFLKKLPALLDLEPRNKEEEKVFESQMVKIESLVADFLGTKPETYYALLLMDGDNMGKWLAGKAVSLKMRSRFHERTLEALSGERAFAEYLEAGRPMSPSWHQAISAGLNAFALHLARVVVEDLFMGKLIYAGGDDVLAMVAVHDLPGLMLALRCAYSGSVPAAEQHDVYWERLTGQRQHRLRIKNGFALLDGRMFRLMGDNATASMGAIVAHHQAPLSRVLADLRAAEKRAKSVNGKDAFSITLDKRAGGTLHFTGQWLLASGFANGDLGLLLDVRDLFAHPKFGISRRAAYLLADSLRDVPQREDALAATLAYRFGRQSRDEPRFGNLPQRLARAAVGRAAEETKDEWPAPNRWLRDLLLVTEFLAREGRAAKDVRNNQAIAKETAHA
jgi:CRISPR-associated protein Cmr2